MKEECKLDVGTALDSINEYYNTMKDKESARYRSWEHCYSAFEDAHSKDIDLLCLNLGFYLASWGMMRGSSFLLQYDYTIHRNAVEIILQEKYYRLRGISANNLLKNIDTLNSLIYNIKKAYNVHSASDTLVSKILLGTLGCVPAYDRFYKNAVRDNFVSSQTLTVDSIRDVAIFYEENKASFDKRKEEITKETNVQYTDMKLMDMCMWQIGYRDYLNSKEKAIIG